MIETMKAIIYDRFGGPEVLRLAEMPESVPGDDDVLIDVKAAGVIPGDTKLRGALKELSNERWRFGWGPFLLAGVGLIIIRTRVRSGVSQSGMISEPAGNRPP